MTKNNVEFYCPEKAEAITRTSRYYINKYLKQW